MKLIKQLNDNMMLDIYECPRCHSKEYYGMMVWKDGHQYCRNCIYFIWTDEGYQEAKHKEEIAAARQGREPNYDNLKYWKPSEEDKVFPIYEDGVNYYEQFK